MIQNIVEYLNLRLETLGRIADLHGISERRKRELDGANVPYCYVGSGEFKAVNIDNGNVGWWRARGGFNMEPVEVIGRAVRQQRATYPLRFVAILRRELSVSDDAFMPSRLAEDIANALNFDNGDLRGILKAINVEARASGGEFDAATIWPTEFQTSIPDLHYELAMVAVDVTVEVVGRYSCWEGECDTDTDILRLFNFCDPSVVARLTDAQRACLEDALCQPCEDVDITINSTQFGTSPSGVPFNVPVVNSGSNPVGSEQSGEWVIGNSTVFINGTQVGDIEAEDSLPIAVELDGNPSGSWNAGTQTWEVTSAPCADATFSIDGVQVDTIASGADLDVSVELNGSPVTPTYNSGTKVIGVTSPPATASTTALPMKTGQTVSYRSGDDGDFEAGRNASFLVLAENNPFGNTNRFTDLVGGQTYAANIVIDWSTYEKSTGKVLMWERTRQGITNWTTAVTNSLALTYNGWTNWRLPNITEGLSLFNWGTVNPLNYAPFTANAIDNYYWTGTTQANASANCVTMGMFVYGTLNTAKTGAARWIAVRTGNISELVIP